MVGFSDNVQGARADMHFQHVAERVQHLSRDRRFIVPCQVAFGTRAGGARGNRSGLTRGIVGVGNERELVGVVSRLRCRLALPHGNQIAERIKPAACDHVFRVGDRHVPVVGIRVVVSGRGECQAVDHATRTI